MPFLALAVRLLDTKKIPDQSSPLVVASTAILDSGCEICFLFYLNWRSALLILYFFLALTNFLNGCFVSRSLVRFILSYQLLCKHQGLQCGGNRCCF